MRKIMILAAMAAVATLAGCQSGGPGPVARLQASGVEGQWVSSDGVAFSSFTAGAFETVAADTGNQLATGSYSYTGDRSVAITVNSVIRQTTTRVNCAMVTGSQLNCTSESGQQFTVVRRVTG